MCKVSLYIRLDNIQITDSDLYSNHVPKRNPTILDSPFSMNKRMSDLRSGHVHDGELRTQKRMKSITIIK